ncbi:MAG TPA: glycoside hydrolase domain-containing protein, partial [Mycobacteriales bacterium]
GRPTAAAIKAAEYDFVIRYVGTPGRKKNLTKSEADGLRNAKVAIALVYEDVKGTALEGRTRGKHDALAAMLDAQSCGVGVRAVYLAVDFDVTSQTQMDAVDAYLDGAADAIGRARVGVYGEHDVIEHCLSAGKATFGWQTMAWSHKQVSPRAHLVQRIGQVEIDGITCDVNEAKKADFGQWPKPGVEENVALTAGEITAIAKAVWAYSISDPHPEGDPDGAPASSHLRWAQARTRVIQELLGVDGSDLPAAPAAPVAADVLAAIRALDAKVDALDVKVATLGLAAGDPAAVRAAIRAELDATRLAGPESTQ